MIFQDASARLHEFRTPNPTPSSNIKRSRRPFTQPHAGQSVSHSRILHNFETPSKTSKAQKPLLEDVSRSQDALPFADPHVTSVEQGSSSAGRISPSAHDRPSLPTFSASVAHGGDVSPLNKHDVGEPISSGFTTPSARCDRPPSTPDEVKYPEFGPTQLPHSISCQSVHEWSSDDASDNGVPIACSESSLDQAAAHVAHIETWLDGVPTQQLDGNTSSANAQNPSHIMSSSGISLSAASSKRLAFSPSPIGSRSPCANQKDQAHASPNTALTSSK